MASLNDHPFIPHPSFARKETCRLCLAEVQAKKETIQSNDAPPKQKQDQLKRCEDQMKRMYWEISKKASERNKHLCYCRHADLLNKAEARRIKGIETTEPGPSTVQLPSFKRKSGQVPEVSSASTSNRSIVAEVEQASISPKRKRASRAVVGKVQSYRDPSDDEGLEKEVDIRPVQKKSKTKVKKQESSDSSESDSDGPKDFYDFFAPSTSSSSRSRSRSTTGTPLSTHQFASNFSRLTTTASPAPSIPSSALRMPSPAFQAAYTTQAMLSNREEALLIDRIEHQVSSMLRECKLPEESDGTEESDAKLGKAKQLDKAKKPDPSKDQSKPNLPIMVYRLQEALKTLKTTAQEGIASAEVAKARAIGAQHLQARLQEIQIAQGIKPVPAEKPDASNDAMWARLETEVAVDEKHAKRKARAARGYSPSRPYYEDSDDDM